MFRAVMFAVILGLAFAAGFGVSKMDTRQKLSSASCDLVPCAHLSARLSAINSMIDQTAGQRRYLIIGDSISEMANWPKLCDAIPVNAGIGWATTVAFRQRALDIAQKTSPSFIVMSLGVNDARQGRDSDAGRAHIVQTLAAWKVFDLGPPGSQFERLPDGIHLSAAGYRDWLAMIKRAVVCPTNTAP